jgi:hypothetical protein
VAFDMRAVVPLALQFEAAPPMAVAMAAFIDLPPGVTVAWETHLLAALLGGCAAVSCLLERGVTAARPPAPAP